MAYKYVLVDKGLNTVRLKEEFVLHIKNEHDYRFLSEQ